MKTSIFPSISLSKLTPTEEQSILLQFEQFVANFTANKITKHAKENLQSAYSNGNAAIY